MSVRRAISDSMLTTGGALAVVIGLVMIDGRVRQEIAMQMSARPSVELASAGARAHDLAMVMMLAVHDQSLAHAPMVIFAVAGFVLFLFMLRT
jgi:hypothetical protein